MEIKTKDNIIIKLDLNIAKKSELISNIIEKFGNNNIELNIDSKYLYIFIEFYSNWIKFPKANLYTGEELFQNIKTHDLINEYICNFEYLISIELINSIYKTIAKRIDNMDFDNIIKELEIENPVKSGKISNDDFNKMLCENTFILEKIDDN